MLSYFKAVVIATVVVPPAFFLFVVYVTWPIMLFPDYVWPEIVWILLHIIAMSAVGIEDWLKEKGEEK